MKILVISAAYPPLQAGEATNAFFLCEHLADRKIDVHVLTSRGNTGTGDARISIHPVMNHWSWGEIPRLRSFLRECSPDAILLMYLGLMYDFHPMITFAPTIAKNLFPRVPFITRFENVWLSADPARTSFISRTFRKLIVQQWAGRNGISYSYGTLLRDSDQIILLCNQHRTYLLKERCFVDTKAVLIPPPPNIRIGRITNDQRQQQRAKLGIGSDDFVIAFFGYIYPVKGVETLLQAFHLVVRMRRRVKLLFIGGKFGMDSDGRGSYVERMYNLAKQLELERDIMWTGQFEAVDDEASRCLHAADAGVFPFLHGVQLNNSSFSSMAAHGLPLIATRGPWLDEAFVHQENVLLCEPNNPEALAQAILLVMDNSELRARLRNGALKLADEWFSWEHATERTVELLSGHRSIVNLSHSWHSAHRSA